MSSYRHFRRTPLLIAPLLVLLWTVPAHAVPSFSRQMGVGCATCHTAFPELNDFGRLFKAKGYDLATIPEIAATAGDSDRPVLQLLKVPPLSAAVIGSYSLARQAIRDAKSSDVLVPDEIGLFYSGKIAPGLGTFLQVSYDSQDDHVSMDMMEVRYAHVGQLGGKELVLGATVNNNPTLSDLWNTTPAWGWPFVTSGVWPGEGSNAALVDGSLAQAAVGGGLYGLWNGSLYGEAAVYRSAPLGAERPIDGSSAQVIDVVAPYWRLAYQHKMGMRSIEVGTYGMYAAIYPGADAGLPLSGATDKYTDLALDAQYEYVYPAKDLSYALHTTWIYERRDLSASAPSSDTAGFHTFRIDADVYWRWAGASAGFFSTMGDNDPAVFGTPSGKPNSNGLVFGLRARPWINTSFIAQYTLYNRLDGRSSNYDGAGRDAGDEDMLSLLAWMAF